jgi:hypothetical protein
MDWTSIYNGQKDMWTKYRSIYLGIISALKNHTLHT